MKDVKRGCMKSIPTERNTLISLGMLNTVSLYLHYNHFSFFFFYRLSVLDYIICGSV